MSRLVTLDLDSPASVERLWHEMERLHALRAADPELREAILTLVDRLDDHDLAAEIREELDRARPAAVCDARWRDFLPNLAWETPL